MGLFPWSHISLVTLPCRACSHLQSSATSILRSDIRKFYWALSKRVSHLGINKKNIASPANSFSVRFTCTEGFCCVLMTSKFREFQTEGGSKRPGWRGPVRGCEPAASFSPALRGIFSLSLSMHSLEKDGASSGFALILSLVSDFYFASLQLSVLLTAWLWVLLVHTLSAYQKLKFVWRSNWLMNAKSSPESFRDAKGKHRYI